MNYTFLHILRQYTKFLVAVTVVATQVVGCRAGVEKQIADVTVCDLVKDPSRFENRAVRVRSVVESDLIEHTMLTDTLCKSEGINLWIPHDLDEQADVRELRKLLDERLKSGALKYQVTAAVTGSFLREGKRLYVRATKFEHVRIESLRGR
jgi:hypothetical protein